MKLEFIDGCEMHAKHPDTFHIPSKSAKETLAPGDYVKIGVKVSELGITDERIWVKIDTIDDNTLTGTWGNQPELFDAELGDPVTFEKRHILSII